MTFRGLNVWCIRKSDIFFLAVWCSVLSTCCKQQQYSGYNKHDYKNLPTQLLLCSFFYFFYTDCSIFLIVPICLFLVNIQFFVVIYIFFFCIIDREYFYYFKIIICLKKFSFHCWFLFLFAFFVLDFTIIFLDYYFLFAWLLLATFC